MKALYESIIGGNNASMSQNIHKLIEQFKENNEEYLHANGDAHVFDTSVPSYSIREIIYNITDDDFYELLREKIDALYHAKNNKDSSQYFIIFGKDKETLFIRLRKVTKDFWYCSWETKKWENCYNNWTTKEYFFPFDHNVTFFHRPKPQEISDELLKELRKQKFDFH